MGSHWLTKLVVQKDIRIFTTGTNTRYYQPVNMGLSHALIVCVCLVVASLEGYVASPTRADLQSKQISPTKADSMKEICDGCRARCIKNGDELDCPDEISCVPCYASVILNEELVADAIMKSVEEEKKQLQKIEAMALSNKNAFKRALKRTINQDDSAKEDMKRKVLAIKRAAEKAAEQTLDIDEMIKIVKKEVGEDTYKEVGEEMSKRIIITTAVFAFSGLFMGTVIGTTFWG